MADSYSVTAVFRLQDRMSSKILGICDKLEGLSHVSANTNEKINSGHPFRSFLGAGIALKGISAAFNTIKNSVGGAVRRFDTLNNFPRIAQSMGVSAGDARKAMRKMGRAIDGLPTSLDSLTRSARTFLPMVHDNMAKASDTAIALNNAFLAGGASAEDASRGLIQYSQMLSKGKVDAQSWHSVQETMGASLVKVAKSFGITSGSTQELYSKLASGKITMSQLNDRFIKLNKGTNGFAQAAKNATGGIGTAMTNVKNRVTKGIASVIDSFNTLTKRVTGTDIAGWINKSTSHLTGAFSKIARGIQKLEPVFKVLFNIGKKIAKFFSSDIGKSIAVAVASMAGVMIIANKFNKLKSALQTAELGYKALTLALSVNPFVLVVAAIVGLVAGLVFFIRHTKKGQRAWQKFIDMLKKVRHAVQAWGKAFGRDVEIAFKAFGLVMKRAAKGAAIAFKAILRGFRALGRGIKKVAQVIGKILVVGVGKSLQLFSKAVKLAFKGATIVFKAAGQVFKAIGEKIIQVFKSLAKGCENAFKAIGNALKEAGSVIKSILSTIKNTFKTVFHAISTIVHNEINNAKNIIQSVMDVISSIISSVLDTISSVIQSVTSTIQSVWSSAWNTISSIVSNVVSTISSVISSGFGALVGIVSGIMSAVSGVFSSIWSSICSICSNAVSQVTSIFHSLGNINLASAGRAIMSSFLGGLKAVWGNIKSFVSGIAGWIKAHKGPIEKDRVLLIDEGNAIMQGFGEGLANSYGEVKENVKTMAAGIKEEFEKSNLNARLHVQSSYSFEENITPRKDLAGLIEELINVTKHGSNIILDSGELVGATVGLMDNSLGKRVRNEGRYSL